jgi:hypothetical protein
VAASYDIVKRKRIRSRGRGEGRVRSLRDRAFGFRRGPESVSVVGSGLTARAPGCV